MELFCSFMGVYQLLASDGRFNPLPSERHKSATLKCADAFLEMITDFEEIVRLSNTVVT